MRLKWFLFWRAVRNALTAPLRWHARRGAERRSHELALARLQVEAATRPMAEMSQALVAVVTEMAKSQNKSAEVLQDWLSGFRTAAAQPASQAPPTDYQEWEREARVEMEQAGLAPDADPLTTMRWLEQTMDLTDFGDRGGVQ